MAFRDLPLAARLYVFFLIIGGGVSAFFSFQIPMEHPWDIPLAVYIALTLITARLNVKIPYSNVHFSVDTAFVFLIMIQYGLIPAIIADASGKMILSLSRFKKNFFKVPFNISSGIVSIYISYLTFRALFFGHYYVINTTYYILPILGMTVAYYLINTMTVAIAICIVEKKNLIVFWYKNFLPAGIGFFIASSIATLMFLLHRQGGPLGFLVIAPMVALMYFFQRLYLQKEEADQKYIGELEDINKQLEQENKERRKAESALEHRVEFEQMVNGISTRFINLPLDQIDQGIHQALETIGNFMDFDRGYVYQMPREVVGMRNTHFWCGHRIANHPLLKATPSNEAFYPLINQLARLERISISHKDRDFAVIERQPELTNLRSLVIIPMVLSGSLVGFLGFDSVVPDRQWPDADIAMLKTVAEIFVNALGRRSMERDRKLLEEQFLQAQKMEAIGRLAGGVAHDFNNLLTGIMGNLKLASVEAPPYIRQYIQGANDAAKRAASVVSQLLTFSRRRKPELQPLDPAQVVHEAMDMLEKTVDRRIIIECHAPEDKWHIFADSAQYYQIIMNLGINARDAITAELRARMSDPSIPDKEYRLRVKLESKKLLKEDCKTNPQATPGYYVVLSVTDNGAGMDEETRKRVFEPFFTTKKSGEGTGLGLPTVFGIVDAHNGWIEIESELGKGTTFQVFVPQYMGRVKAAGESEKGMELPGGHETILLVDDDTEIRKLAQVIFERYGYRIMLAADGKEGLEKFMENREKIDLVILDHAMPYLSGMEVLQQIRAVTEETKVLMTSGFPNEGDLELHERLNTEGFMPKPFDLFDLLTRVREIFENHTA